MGTVMQADWERRPRNGGLIAIAGGVLMVVGVFLPWLTGGGNSLTGWELYDRRQEAGDNPFVVDKMFDSTFDPFFTGAPVLVLGVLLGLIGVGIYAARKRPPPSRYRVSPGLYITGMLLGVVAFLMVFLDVFSTLRAPELMDVSIGMGLIVSGLGIVAVVVGIGQSSATRRELAAGSAWTPPQAPAAPVPQPVVGAPQPPNWYPDPAGHHQMRFWDGATWSSHVSDNGVQSEDPLVPTG